MSRKLFLAFFLILFVQAVFSQKTETKSEAEKADELKKQAVEFLRETSRDVGNLRTLENRISFSAEIAGLMWFHDEKEARAMYQITINDFRQLLTEINVQFSALDTSEQTEEVYDDFLFGEMNSKALLMRRFEKAIGVRQQIALSIAEHNAQMGYEFFTGTSQVVTNAKLLPLFAEREFYTELKILDLMIEQDVDKALENGRKMLAAGKTVELLGLLKKIYEKDDEKGAAFGEEIISKIKSIGVKDSNYYNLLTILRTGLENLEKIKGKTDKKPMFSESSLRDIADLLAQEILKQDVEEISDVETYAVLIEKFSPARAAQIRLKFKDRKTNESNSNVRMSNSSMNINSNINRQNEVAEQQKQQEKFSEEVGKLADKELPKEERDKIVADARKIISKLKNREQKIMALSTLAMQVSNLGDKELALEIMGEARNLVTLQPKNYRDYLGVWMLTTGYSQIDAEKAFPILEDAVSRLNETISAFIKVGEFIDVNSDFIEDGEVQVGSFGGELTRGLLRELGAANTTLQSLAKTDFARTRALTNRFDRLEVRILAKMLILRAVLGEQKDKEDEDEVRTEK